MCAASSPQRGGAQGPFSTDEREHLESPAATVFPVTATRTA